VPPNCMQGYCAPNDPNCWTCTDPQYIIDPNFVPPSHCSEDGCQFLPIVSSACPLHTRFLPECHVGMPEGELCRASRAPPSMNAGEVWDIDNCGKSNVFEFVCPPPSGWCNEEEEATCSCEKCPEGQCIRDKQGNCRIFDDGYHCSIGSVGLDCPYQTCFEESGMTLFAWRMTGADLKQDPCQEPHSPTEGMCYINLCGCPGADGAFLEPWCNNLRQGQKPIVASEWCQSNEENCGRCGGAWCSVQSSDMTITSTHCGVIPDSCQDHIGWAHEHGKYQHPEWYLGFEEITGVSLDEGSRLDMAQYFYCLEIQKNRL